jgi:cell division protein FtsB
VDTGPDGYKSVNYPALVAPLIESAKALWARLRQYGGRLAEVERRLATVEARNHELEERIKKLESRLESLESRSR